MATTQGLKEGRFRCCTRSTALLHAPLHRPHARIDEEEHFDERWDAEGKRFLPPQPNGFDDSPFCGDQEDRELVAVRTVFRITSHMHPELGDAIVAHVSVPKAYSALRVADGSAPFFGHCRR